MRKVISWAPSGSVIAPTHIRRTYLREYPSERDPSRLFVAKIFIRSLWLFLVNSIFLLWASGSIDLLCHVAVPYQFHHRMKSDARDLILVTTQNSHAKCYYACDVITKSLPAMTFQIVFKISPRHRSRSVWHHARDSSPLSPRLQSNVCCSKSLIKLNSLFSRWNFFTRLRHVYFFLVRLFRWLSTSIWMDSDTCLTRTVSSCRRRLSSSHRSRPTRVSRAAESAHWTLTIWRWVATSRAAVSSSSPLVHLSLCSHRWWHSPGEEENINYHSDFYIFS